MSKTLQKALIELVLFMAGMIVSQGNIFGTANTAALNKKIENLIDKW